MKTKLTIDNIEYDVIRYDKVPFNRHLYAVIIYDGKEHIVHHDIDGFKINDEVEFQNNGIVWNIKRFITREEFGLNRVLIDCECNEMFLGKYCPCVFSKGFLRKKRIKEILE